MKRIDILFFDATSGHRTAAFALEKALMMQDITLQIRVINLLEVLETHKVLQAIARIGVDTFNWGVRRESAWFLSQQVGLFQMIQANVPDYAIQEVAQFWQSNAPDMVVSVLPISNWLLERALHHACPTCPYIVIPVDFEESKENYWLDTRMDAYYLNPTAKLAEQAKNKGLTTERSLRVAGMPIDPVFYNNPPHDKAHRLEDMGLNPANPTVLVCFGGQGSVLVERCAAKLSEIQQPINAIFLCGRHKQLFDNMNVLSTSYPKAVLDYIDEPPAYYYHLADVLIGKPGSMTITEAIITRTPFVAVEAQSLALVQRGNEAWLRQSDVGEVATLETLSVAVERILTDNAVHDSIEREWHRGVFEIVAILLQFLDTGIFQAVQHGETVGEQA